MNIDYEIKLNQDNDWNMKKHHFHENYEILLSLTNSGSIFLENNVYNIKRGTLILIKNTSLHRTMVDKKNLYKRYIIHFPESTLSEISSKKTDLLSKFCGDDICIQLSEKQLEKTILIIEKITNTEPEKFGSDVLKDITFVELLIIITNFFNNNTNKNSTSNFKFNKVYPIIKYIERNIEGDLSLDSISDNFYISKYHLCRIFKESTGFTLREYIINTRILKSCTFLRKGCNVQTAGELAGFNNNSHFIRTFSKLKGISPGQYMKKYK